MRIAMTSPTPARYFSMVASAHTAADRAASRVTRLYADAQKSPLASLGVDRLIGAVQQADEAMQLVAAAERYRLRDTGSRIPPSGVRYVLQAIEDLESGSRALRRATALIADPGIDQDPEAREATLHSIGLADSHYRMADWLLEEAPHAANEPQTPTPGDVTPGQLPLPMPDYRSPFTDVQLTAPAR